MKFIFKGGTDITDAAYKSCSTKMLPKGSVLLTSRAPVGTVAIAMTDLCTNQGFKSIIPNRNLGAEFVYYFLKENKTLLDSHASFKMACQPIFAVQIQNEAEIRELVDLQGALISQISGR